MVVQHEAGLLEDESWMAVAAGAEEEEYEARKCLGRRDRARAAQESVLQTHYSSWFNDGSE
jgi:hypothetical protein